MLETFKKILIQANSPPLTNTLNNNNIKSLEKELQDKYSNGVSYNMKIIIKGDKNVGKTSLFNRLQGMDFQEKYNPTLQIQIANINWNFKNTNTIVKVEIWDIVDNGLKITENGSIKFNNNKNNLDFGILDSNNIDVQKGAHGVLYVLDVTRKWTLDYIINDIEKLTCSIPILILANKRDLEHKQVISLDDIYSMINTIKSKNQLIAATHIKVIESSMKNNYGLKYIHKFFNLPFLELERESLLSQLATNSENIHIVLEELKLHPQSTETDHGFYLPETQNISQPLPKNDLTPKNQLSHVNVNTPVSKIINVVSKNKDEQNQNNYPGTVAINPPLPNAIDNFCPVTSDSLDYSFFDLGDIKSPPYNQGNNNQTKTESNENNEDIKKTDYNSDDSDSNNPNPMVIIYQEDLDD